MKNIDMKKAFVIDVDELNSILKRHLNIYIGVDDFGWFYGNTDPEKYEEVRSKVLNVIGEETKMEIEYLLIDTTSDKAIVFCK